MSKKLFYLMTVLLHSFTRKCREVPFWFLRWFHIFKRCKWWKPYYSSQKYVRLYVCVSNNSCESTANFHTMLYYFPLEIFGSTGHHSYGAASWRKKKKKFCPLLSITYTKGYVRKMVRQVSTLWCWDRQQLVRFFSWLRGLNNGR